MSRSFLVECQAVLGESKVWTEPEQMKPYRTDFKTGFWGDPMAVCFPQNAEQMEALVKLSYRYKVPMVPRGAGTGRSGGAVPPDGGIVISTQEMTQIHEIDPESLFVTVEPGLILADLQSEMSGHGLFYPPDPASLKTCTLGGNVAENAGGPRAFKYGVTRDYVLGMEVILPQGDRIFCGTRTRKGVAGYDMTGLMVGSEGTLGLISSIVLRLLPEPQHHSTMLALFDSVLQAAEAVNLLIRASVIPASLELMDRHALNAVRRASPFELEPKAQAALLIELDGSFEQVQLLAKILPDTLAPAKPLQFWLSEDLDEREQMWSVRRMLSERLRENHKYKISEDVVVPRSKLPELVESIEKIAASLPLDIAQYGHAGDGNLHVNFLWNEDEHFSYVQGAVEEVFRVVLRLRGTITGEHGIGLCKRRYLPWEQSASLLNVQESIKRTLDPEYLMNPGKIFPVPSSLKQPVFHEESYLTKK